MGSVYQSGEWEAKNRYHANGHRPNLHGGYAARINQANRAGRPRQGRRVPTEPPLTSGTLTNGMHVGQDASDAAVDATTANGPISQLQELVQADKKHPAAPHQKVLHWEYQQKMPDGMTLEFRAVVSFQLEGVVHHALGDWCTSKKCAARDAAARVLGLLLGQSQGYPPRRFLGDVRLSDSSAYRPSGQFLTDEEVFEEFCATMEAGSPMWEIHYPNASDSEHQALTCSAHVKIHLFGAPHTFPGALCSSEEVAKQDVMRKILWYFKVSGYENAFHLPSQRHSSAAICPAPRGWCRDLTVPDAGNMAEIKTRVMRVQNRLQRVYKKHLQAGEPVWRWHFDYLDAPSGCRSCRAHARVNTIEQKEFISSWHEGLKAEKTAQLEVAGLVSRFLDDEKLF